MCKTERRRNSAKNSDAKCVLEKGGKGGNDARVEHSRNLKRSVMRVKYLILLPLTL